LAVNKFAKLYTIDNETRDIYQAHNYHKPNNAVCVLRCQVSQRDKDNGCRSGKDELQAQLTDAVNEIAVAHAIY
jgi:hypothetical protein